MDPKVILFDLDGTLTPSKSYLRADMAVLICKLLHIKKVVVIGGGSHVQFQKQFIEHINCNNAELDHLYIMPTSGAALYRHTKGAWNKVYIHALTAIEKKKILYALSKTMSDLHYHPPEKIYGETIEDRGAQVSFSANGQDAPLSVKSKWDPDQAKRTPIVMRLKTYLPEFDIKIGGTNTIDITKHGINKAYGVRRVVAYLGFRIHDAVYVGDALYENGNDAIVKETGISVVSVGGPKETMRYINAVLAR
ncbi:MAG: HAD-IIB family hydrolase [Patescibacteria group bacterium]|nr:HAD-IIB family hydrolase [Patescibacteria group bacterium]MDE2438231.1 HAD-IIB family hydrolase [Patescibacteria group bacterium]